MVGDHPPSPVSHDIYPEAGSACKVSDLCMRRVLDQMSHLKSTSKVLTPPCFANKLRMYEASVIRLLMYEASGR